MLVLGVIVIVIVWMVC